MPYLEKEVLKIRFSVRHFVIHRGIAPEVLNSLREQRLAVRLFGQREPILPGIDMVIEGDTEITAILAVKSFPFIGKIHRRTEALIEIAEIFDLPADLAVWYGNAVADPVHSLLLRHRDSALVHHAVVFFLQLHKHLVFLLCLAVAADAKLFLVHGFFDAATDKSIVFSIEVNIANGGAAILVQGHIGLHDLQEQFLLLCRQQIFQFIPLKDCLVSHAFTSIFLEVQSSTVISSPSSAGRNRGHTFSEEVITEAASTEPISMAWGKSLP